MSADDLRYLSESAEVRRVDLEGTRGTVSGIVWGSDPRVTLLHGAGLNAHTWDDTVQALGASPVAVDLPGHGCSAWWPEFDYTAEHLAPAVAEYLDGLGVRDQLVVGHSLGGIVGIELAASRPELVRSLVLVDITPGLRAADAAPLLAFFAGPLVFESREQLVEVALAAGLGGSREAVERGVYYNTLVRHDGSVVFRHHLASAPPGAVLSLDFSGAWHALESLDIPVLLVRATSGFLPDVVVAEFRERVPWARVVELDSVHNVQEQRPVELAAIVREELDRA